MSDALPLDSKACAHCGSLLQAGARVCAACGELVAPTHGGQPQDAYATTDLALGEVLEGTWQLEQIIGRGGMGAVFLAHDVKLGRQVAVKALSANLADAEFVSRFEREARVLGILDHPNIVAIHGIGRHRGCPFIVMKLIDGDPLRSYVDARGGRLKPLELLPVARQICSALSYIHSKEVIHRDLKPSNIMISAAGHVTVFDLGIARPHDSNLTKTGIIFGTPGYMAPELIVGEKHLDGRLDIYALGVILYELVTNQSPFVDAHEESLLRAHLMKPRPDASVVNAELPPALGQVLQKAMAIDPRDRYPDADELYAALETACGVRQFHEAATIKRTPLAREALSPPYALEPRAPPDAAPRSAEPRSAEPRKRPTPPSSKSSSPGARPRSASRDPVPKPGSRSDLPRAPSREEPPRPASRADVPRPAAREDDPGRRVHAPARAEGSAAAAQPPRSRSQQVPRKSSQAVPAQPASRAAAEDDDLERALRPWWQRKPALLFGGAGVLACALAAGALLLGREDSNFGEVKPLPARLVAGPEDTPPAPVVDSGSSTEAAQRPELVEVTRAGGDARRVRDVKPRITLTPKPFAGAPKDWGELQIEVRVNGTPVPAKLTMDGEPLGPSPVFVPAKAGTHQLLVSHPPFPPSSFPAQVRGETSLKVEVELQPPEGETTAATNGPG